MKQNRTILPENYSTKSNDFSIREHKATKTFQIIANKDVRQKILEFAFSQKNELFAKEVVNHKKSLESINPPRKSGAKYQNLKQRTYDVLKGKFIEIDYRTLDAILKNQESLKIHLDRELSRDYIKQIENGVEKEKSLESELTRYFKKSPVRIWQNQDINEVGNTGTNRYFCEVEGDIYSSNNLYNLTSMIKGNYLIESNKPLTKLSLTTPHKAFGIFDSLKDMVFDSNKSVIHYNFKDNKRKKQFTPLIEDFDKFTIIIDGADDTANAMTNTGLPQQTANILQAFLIFPAFLKGVSLGVDGVGDEANEALEEHRDVQNKITDFKVKIEEILKEICSLCKIYNPERYINDPENFLEKITLFLNNASQKEKTELIKAINEFQIELENQITHEDNDSLRQVLMTRIGHFAMISMATSVGVYNVQALLNSFGLAQEGITTNTLDSSKVSIAKQFGSTLGEFPQSSLFSQIGNSCGFAGQIMMVFYALHKTYEERKEWLEVEEELSGFKDSKNVSELAKNITTSLLEAKKLNHEIKTFGNLALALGQAGMSVGGPMTLGISTILYSGLASTLSGIAFSSMSEISYDANYPTREHSDAIEREILNQPMPQLTRDSDILSELEKHRQKQIFALELLSHLRAPQFVLYQKFLEEHKDDKGIFGALCSITGIESCAKWMFSPSFESINWVKENPNIAINPNSPYDLNIFSIDDEWLAKIMETASNLAENHNSKKSEEEKTQTHKQITCKLQIQFITEKKSQQPNTADKNSAIIESCRNIIAQDGNGGFYLLSKLMRAVANNELSYNGDLHVNAEVRKNGEEVKIARLDLNNFNQEELVDFLTTKKMQKNISQQIYLPDIIPAFKMEKQSPIEKSLQDKFPGIKADYLSPFREIVQINNRINDLMKDENQNVTGITRNPSAYRTDRTRQNSGTAI